MLVRGLVHASLNRLLVGPIISDDSTTRPWLSDSSRTLRVLLSIPQYTFYATISACLSEQPAVGVVAVHMCRCTCTAHVKVMLLALAAKAVCVTACSRHVSISLYTCYCCTVHPIQRLPALHITQHVGELDIFCKVVVSNMALKGPAQRKKDELCMVKASKQWGLHHACACRPHWKLKSDKAPGARLHIRLQGCCNFHGVRNGADLSRAVMPLMMYSNVCLSMVAAMVLPCVSLCGLLHRVLG